MLLSINQRYNLKAIHNTLCISPTKISVVINKSKIQFESNSQLALESLLTAVVVINKSKIQFESNSQQVYTEEKRNNCCYQ